MIFGLDGDWKTALFKYHISIQFHLDLKSGLWRVSVNTFCLEDENGIAPGSNFE